MKKTFRMMLALTLMFLGVTTASAEKVSLEEVPFCSWDGWTADAKSTGTADCAWVLDESTGQPYGDPSVINYADLSAYTKLIVEVTDGSPRFLLNRDKDEGQWADTEAESHLIDNTKGGWSSKYFTTEGENVYVVDLKAIVKDKGFCHLHAIKGANWSNVTVTRMELEKAGNAVSVGWNNIITNSDMEGDDNSSFFTKVADGDPLPSEIQDGIGVDGSRGIVVDATDKVKNPWDNQFWFRFTEPVPAGTKYRVRFDYRADEDATAATQAHAEPGDYIHWDMLGNVSFTSDWQTFEKEGTITADQSKDDKKFQSVAFNLNDDSHPGANKYYFDNIYFEVYKLGTLAEFAQDIIKIDFGFDTNIPALVAATGKPRLLFPKSCVKVTVDGEPLSEDDITSVEAFADGRFYIFFEDMIENYADNSNFKVEVKFINPTDPAYHLVYTSEAVKGQDVANFEGEATENEDIAMEPDAIAYIYVTPIIIASDPEEGSFNLPNNIKEFNVTFDKLANCRDMVATLNGKSLSIEPVNPVTIGDADQGFKAAESVILKRDWEGDLSTGTYTIKITKVFPEASFDEDTYGTYEYSFYVGEVVVDPSDTIKAVVTNTFATTQAGGIPEGYLVNFNGEERTFESTYGSGPRMFDFGEGGDFTKGLYFREGYVQYGTQEGYELKLEGGKKYRITFNSAMWKDNGSQMTFSILNPADEDAEAYLSQTINNTPNVNGSQNAVTGSTATSIDFTPAVTDNYMLRWSVGGFNEIILANVEMKYIPSTMGIEETQLLNDALANAKAALDANGAERYAGVDYNSLSAAVTKYEAEKSGYTAPSKFKAAAAELDALTAALKDHRSLCDNYDTQIKKSLDVERQNAEKKFNATELYAQIKALNAKYHATSEWVSVPDPEDPEAEPTTELVYTFDVLTDNDALTVAVKELTDAAKVGSLLFTEGESNTADTGVKVLFERLRLGLASMSTLAKALDEAVDEQFVEDVNMALIDDDNLAELVKLSIKKLLYSDLKNADSKLFAVTIDETTEEEVIPSYDMTVFVKNPNVYKLSDKTDFTDEAVPGWTVPEGFNRPQLSWGWGSTQGTSTIAEDCMFQTWGGAYRVEQTVTDLPAGVYTIKIGFGERMQDDAASNIDQSFVFAKLSDTPAVEPVEEGEEPNEEDRDYNFAAWAECPGIGQTFPKANTEMEVTVLDGILTIGANAASGSHTFFNDVRLLMSNKTNADYAAAYNEVIGELAPVDNVREARVRGVELYDLNGRRIVTANKGIQIVKKYMSDGTVRIEKVVKK